MRKTLSLLLILSVSCSVSKLSSSKQRGNYSNYYKVYKIDSVNNFYLIYARKRDSLYKIVSQKHATANCVRIQENGEYEFTLHSSLSNRSVGTDVILPQNSLSVNCFNYNDSTTICLERDSINDLFYADNLKGLCFKKKNN